MSAQPLQNCISLIQNKPRFDAIVSYLAAQGALSKVRAPGVVPLLIWVTFTVIFWGLAGYIIYSTI